MTASDVPAPSAAGARRPGQGTAVTVGDVAREAGVSVATVSRAMRGLPNVPDATRRRVHEVADAFGYQPDPYAARLASGKTATVGVAVPLLNQWYFSQVVASMHERLAEAGYDLLLFSVGDQFALDSFVDHAYYRKRIDALAFLDLPLSEFQLDKLEADGARVVISGGPSQGRYSVVSIDDYLASRTATAHLIEQGHQKIAFMGEQPAHSFRFPVADRRRLGFLDEMAAHGIGSDEAQIVAGGFTVEGGVVAGGLLLDSAERPTAVVCASDEMAIGVLAAARRRGVAVPGEMSVIGFDDHDMAEAFGLTTIAQSVRDQGISVANLTLEAIAGDDPRAEIRSTELLVRETVGPPPPQ